MDKKITNAERLFDFIKRNGYNERRVCENVRLTPEFFFDLRWETMDVMCEIMKKEVGGYVADLWEAIYMVQLYEEYSPEQFSDYIKDPEERKEVIENMLTCISACVANGRSMRLERGSMKEPEQEPELAKEPTTDQQPVVQPT